MDEKIMRIGVEFRNPPQIQPGQEVNGKEIVERIGRRLARQLLQEAGQAGIYGLSDADFLNVLLIASAAPLACILKSHVMGLEGASLKAAADLGRTTVEMLLTWASSNPT